MNPFGNDLKSSFEFNLSLVPAARAATANGTGIDCSNYDGPLTVKFSFGVCTDGTYVPSVEESDDNSSFSAVTPYEGSFTDVTSSAGGSANQTVQIKRTKRYVRCVLTESVNGTTGVLSSAEIIGRKKNV